MHSKTGPLLLFCITNFTQLNPNGMSCYDLHISYMVPKTEIINHRIANSVLQLARFLKPGDIFRKARGRTQYRFNGVDAKDEIIVCENLDTHVLEELYYSSPVFKIVFV